MVLRSQYAEDNWPLCISYGDYEQGSTDELSILQNPWVHHIQWLSRSEGKPGFSSLKYCRCGGFNIFPLILWKILSSKRREKCPPLELNPVTCFSWTEYDRNCDLCVCDFQTRHKRYCRFLVILSPSSLTVAGARREGRQLTRAPSNPPERFTCHEKEATCRHPMCELSSNKPAKPLSNSRPRNLWDTHACWCCKLQSFGITCRTATDN